MSGGTAAMRQVGPRQVEVCTVNLTSGVIHDHFSLPTTGRENIVDVQWLPGQVRGAGRPVCVANGVRALVNAAVHPVMFESEAVRDLHSRPCCWW